ncbi:hypothetical protein POI8812_01203 [Pontivivens insulae]|uniref:Uncharacterized protein n=1 Tax=Pontivivens insulae TaxID=1639689 RepID=A0A2R8A9Z1_9RHOB|nr:hypothetical protein DFR53_1939 [Pontivivens insulae]SPF28900.1 hypothetical protein POI8812_01203 [Pontivivens insulae]
MHPATEDVATILKCHSPTKAETSLAGLAGGEGTEVWLEPKRALTILSAKVNCERDRQAEKGWEEGHALLMMVYR